MVIGVHIINPDGSMTEDEGSDLFWALRGGGYGLGVVTEYKIAIHDPPESFMQIVISYPMK